jgi:5-(carboxyamino)imidazole ribonucleotide synthase
MVGGGQLARMTQPAAIALGIRLRVLVDRSDDPAAQVVANAVVGDYRDLETLRAFAAECDVITFDHEHVPNEHLRALTDAGVVVRPGPDALRYAQDKGLMRARLTELGLPCPTWRIVSGPAADGEDTTEGALKRVLAFAEETDWPIVLKATRGGYDGKGVWVVADASEAAEVVAGAREHGTALLAERLVRFRRELAAVVARSPHGQAAAYPIVETVQRDGVCREVLAPAPGMSPDAAAAAQRVALRVATELDVTGVLAVEMFDTPDGVLINELAMRPHNSGHWTIDGAVTSQFEQHLRAVLDLPLGDPRPRAPYAVMTNVLGLDLAEIYPAYLHCLARDPGLRVHMYGKTVRPGRKIGHVTVTGDDLADCRERAGHAAAFLRGEIDE